MKSSGISKSSDGSFFGANFGASSGAGGSELKMGSATDLLDLMNSD
jgi:hypothetical protein